MKYITDNEIMEMFGAPHTFTINTTTTFIDKKPKNSFEIKKVHFNDPATVVIWADGTKTVVKCGEEDIYDPQTGLLMCIAKKAFGNNGKFNDILREWVPEEVNAVDAAVNAFEAFANLMHATLVKKEDI